MHMYAAALAKASGFGSRQTLTRTGAMVSSTRMRVVPASMSGSTAKLLTCTSPPAQQQGIGTWKGQGWIDRAQWC